MKTLLIINTIVSIISLSILTTVSVKLYIKERKSKTAIKQIKNNLSNYFDAFLTSDKKI